MKYFLVFILLILNSANAFEIKKVNIYCEGRKVCSYYEKNKNELVKKYSSFEDFMSVFQLYFSKDNYREFKYEVIRNELTISLKEKKKVNSVEIIGVKKSLAKKLLKSIDLDLNRFFNLGSLKKSMVKIQKELISKGYENAIVEYELREQEQTVDIDVKVELGKLRKVSRVIIRCNDKVYEMVASIIKPIKDKAFNRELFSRYRDEVEEALISQGYYFSRPVFKQLQNTTSFMLECGSLKRVALQIFDEEGEFNKENMYLDFRKHLVSSGRGFSENLIRMVLLSDLEKRGYTDREFTLEREVDIEDKDLEHIKIHLKKGEKLKISDLSFKGNRFYSNRVLRNLFYKTESNLIAENLWDESYFKDFLRPLKNHYIKSGFLSPRVKMSTNKKKAEIAYSIEEGVRTRVRTFVIKNEKNEDLDDFSKFYKYEKNQAFNPIEFGDAIKKYKKDLLEKGYYYSVLESSEREIVTFNPNNSLVDIKINFHIGKKIILKDFTYIGLVATQKFMLEKTLNDLKGKTLTPLLMKRIRRRVGNLNLFKNFKTNVLLAEDQESVDIVINFEEKKYGLLELSPGFRTDLGLKLSSRYLRENIMGKGQILDVGVGVNYRLNLDNLAPYRQESQMDNTQNPPVIVEPKRFLEYSIQGSYSYPYFLNTNWDNFSSLSFSRVRYYEFDANIFRISNTIKRNFNQNIGFTGTYQFEWLKQENSTQYWSGTTKDGTFRIGSLVPSLIFDYRDNPIFPKKGFHIKLSYEISKSFLGSQLGDKSCSFNSGTQCSPKVDFGKFVSRSKFYYPLTKKLYFASSLAFGYENNWANDLKKDSSGNTIVDIFGEPELEGFIPAIKVFRLSGVDLVRGYTEQEINLLNSGGDISEETISNNAFMTNFKFESRYAFTDSITAALFFDAGSIQINKFRAFDLRTSVGVSLKYLTPVGTIDLDYGIKLKRRTSTQFGKESPGEFRLSIGFF